MILKFWAPLDGKHGWMYIDHVQNVHASNEIKTDEDGSKHQLTIINYIDDRDGQITHQTQYASKNDNVYLMSDAGKTVERLFP